MARSKFSFPGHGGAPAARLELPGAPRVFALFAHSFSLAAARIARAMTRGIAVFRFDFTGLGASEGEPPTPASAPTQTALVCAADHLRREHQAPALLVGHSLDGTAMLTAARDMPQAVAVATIAAPAEPARVARQFGAAEGKLEAQDEVEVELGGRPFRIRRQFLDDVHDSRGDDCIAQPAPCLAGDGPRTEPREP